MADWEVRFEEVNGDVPPQVLEMAVSDGKNLLVGLERRGAAWYELSELSEGMTHGLLELGETSMKAVIMNGKCLKESL